MLGTLTAPRHRHLLLGAGLAVVLVAVGVAGAAVQWWWLVVLAALALQAAVLLVALDADRRVRELRGFVKDQIGQIDMTGGRGAPAQEDVVGTVRLLQEQYLGRLDRLQDTVEASLRRDDAR